ncbi:unnamed protein product, partial [Prorocentrum cordatum]
DPGESARSSSSACCGTRGAGATPSTAGARTSCTPCPTLAITAGASASLSSTAWTRSTCSAWMRSFRRPETGWRTGAPSTSARSATSTSSRRAP